MKILANYIMLVSADLFALDASGRSFSRGKVFVHSVQMVMNNNIIAFLRILEITILDSAFRVLLSFSRHSDEFSARSFSSKL